MRKNGFAPLIIILVIAILGVVGYLLYKNLAPSLPKVPSSPIVTSSPSEQGDIFSKVLTAINDTKGLDKHLVVFLSKNSDGMMFWYSQDGYLITVPNGQQVLLKYSCDASTSNDLRPIIPSLVTSISNVLKQDGFQRIGTKPSLGDSDWTSLSAGEFGSDNYLNGDLGLYCNLSVDVGCGKSETDTTFNQKLYFTCSSKENYNTNYADQSKILGDMQIKGLTLTKVSSYQSYMLFDENGEWGPGAYLVAKETNGKWTKLFGGQDNPSCAIVDQYKVPHQLGHILTQCVDSKGDLVDNPN